MLPAHFLLQLDLFFPSDDVMYVTPGGVMHYIQHHGYAPPAEFLAAVLRFPAADSLEYLAALRQANAGNIPPLEPTDDDDGDGTNRKL